MPIVHVKMAAGRTQSQKTALARDITDALMRRCDAAPENINILFEDVPLEHWLTGSDAIANPVDGGGEP